MGNDASSQYGKKIENNMNVTWTKADVTCPFLPREGQATAVIGSCLYMFGGVILSQANDEEPVTESDELIVYDVKFKKWSKESSLGKCPSQRSGATMASIKQSLYLFGGLSQLSGWLNDLHVYDTVTKEWNEIDVCNVPSPRDKVMSAAIGDKIYIFGGFGPVPDDEIVDDDDVVLDDDDDDDEYEDMDELQEVRNCQDAANFTWSDHLYVFDSIAKTWSLINVENNKLPTPRAAHSLTYIREKSGSDCLYVFGGRDAQSRRNDLWRFNIAESEWKECKSIGCPPPPCSFHAAAAVCHRLVIYGGRGMKDQHFNELHIFDTETSQWLQPKTTKNDDNLQNKSADPPAIGLHSLCVTDLNVVLYGGSSELDPATGTCTKVFNDVYTVPVSDILSGGAVQLKEGNETNESIQLSVPGILNLKPNSTAEANDS